MRPELILWDWNGTLLDDVELCVDALNRLLADFGYPQRYDRDQYRAIFGFPIEEYYTRAGFDFSRHSFAELAARYMEIYVPASEVCPLMDGAAEALQAFRSAGLRQVILSASKRKLHCECPSGGSPQLKAIKCASKSPSVCLVRPPPCGRLNTPDIPFSKKRLRTRCTRNLPTFKNPPIISSDCFFPSDSSQLSSINASNTWRALRFPLDTIWFSSSFSSSVKQKRYFASAISNLH